MHYEKKRRQRWQLLCLQQQWHLQPAGEADRALEMVGNTSAGGNAGSGSSTQAEESDKNAIKDLVTYEAPNREQEGFFILNTEKAADLNILCNLYAPLIEVDENGKLRPAVAKEWGTEGRRPYLDL